MLSRDLEYLVEPDEALVPRTGDLEYTAINTATNSKYEATTAANGGYTIQVPAGTYRIEVEIRAGETLAKHPDEVRIHNGDLDAGRDFVVTVK